MPISKTIVCLANSDKHRHRCVAGKEIVKDEVRDWIRPVGDREGSGVSEGERCYRAGREPALLDLVRVGLIRSQPWEYQTENWLLDPTVPWVRTKRLDWEVLPNLVDTCDELWHNGDSSWEGNNDQMSLEVATGFADSIALVQVTDLTLRVIRKSWNGKSQVRSKFSLNGHNYDLTVTDPIVKKLFLGKELGAYPIGDSYLTVSVSEPLNGYCYKLTAAILAPALEGAA